LPKKRKIREREREREREKRKRKKKKEKENKAYFKASNFGACSISLIFDFLAAKSAVTCLNCGCFSVNTSAGWSHTNFILNFILISF